MSFAELESILPRWALRAFVVWFGLIWGSFLNVVIYRVPLGMSVVRPASHCPGCGKPVRGYDNIPVLSYLILRGRARCCGARMSPRYPMVELMGGALSLAIFEGVILKLDPAIGVGHAAAIYGADLALCLGLLSAAFIDVEHMFLPPSITIGGVVLGILTATLRGHDFGGAIVGAAVGFLMVWVPFDLLFKRLFGLTAMAMGDAMLVAVGGAWFGWPGALAALFGGAIHGSIYALIAKVFGIEHALPKAVQEDIAELRAAAARGDEEAIRELAEDPLTEEGESAPHRNRIPFGPFLVLAIFEMLFFEEWLTAHVHAIWDLPG